MPLSGYIPAGTRFMQLGTSESQQRAFDWYLQALKPINSATIIATLGLSSLTARLSLTGGVSGSLPKNQWQIEVDNWFATRLAYLQKIPINTAYGPTDDRLWNFMERPKDKESKKICRNQVSPYSVIFVHLLHTNGYRKSGQRDLQISAYSAYPSSTALDASSSLSPTQWNVSYVPFIAGRALIILPIWNG